MISEIISKLAIIYLGLPVIFIAYLIKRKFYMNKYGSVQETRRAERVNYVVADDTPLEWVQLTEMKPEFEVKADDKRVTEEAVYVSVAEEVEEDELMQREVVVEEALQPVSADEETVEAKLPIAMEEELPVRVDAAAQETSVPNEEVALADAGSAAVNGNAVKAKKRAKIPVLVKAGLIAVPLVVAYNGFKQASEADRKLKEVEEMPLLQEEAASTTNVQENAALPMQQAAGNAADTFAEVKSEAAIADAGGETAPAASGEAQRDVAVENGNNAMLDVAAERQRMKAAREERRRKAAQTKENKGAQMDFGDIVNSPKKGR